MALWGGSHARYFRELPRKSLHNFLSTVCPGTGRPRDWGDRGGQGDPRVAPTPVRVCMIQSFVLFVNRVL
jgi:hypothetical protein